MAVTQTNVRGALDCIDQPLVLLLVEYYGDLAGNLTTRSHLTTLAALCIRPGVDLNIRDVETRKPGLWRTDQQAGAICNWRLTDAKQQQRDRLASQRMLT